MNTHKTCEIYFSDEDLNKLSNNTKTDVCVKVYEKGLWVGSDNVFKQGSTEINRFDYTEDCYFDE